MDQIVYAQISHRRKVCGPPITVDNVMERSRGSMLDRWLPEVTQRGRRLILLLPPLRLDHLRPADGASI